MAELVTITHLCHFIFMVKTKKYKKYCSKARQLKLDVQRKFQTAYPYHVQKCCIIEHSVLLRSFISTDQTCNKYTQTKTTDYLRHATVHRGSKGLFTKMFLHNYTVNS